MTKTQVLERPQTRAKVIAWLVEGKGPTEIASLVSTPKRPVTRQAVCAFAKRHAEDITPIVAEVEQAIRDIAIQDKTERLRELGRIYVKCADALDEYGVMITEERTSYTRDGDPSELIVTRKFNGGLIKEMRGVLRDVAEELNDIARPPVVSITNDNRKYVLSWDDGAEA